VKNLKIKLVYIIPTLLLVGCGPSTYEECILENMKGVSSDIAARAIHGACRKKFSEDLPSPIPAPEAAAPAPAPEPANAERDN
jgi:hypothetical protein